MTAWLALAALVAAEKLSAAWRKQWRNGIGGINVSKHHHVNGGSRKRKLSHAIKRKRDENMALSAAAYQPMAKNGVA
jgi:hypothetical protein